MNTTKDDNNLKEPVKLRYKALKDGNQSIYLDCYVNGIREYKFLSLYLRPETSRENKLWNREQLRLANAIKAQYIIDIQNGEYGFKDRNRSRKLNFITYCEEMAAEYEANGQNSCAVLMRSAIKRMTDYKGKNITFNHIDKDFLIGFIEYLNSDIRDFDKAAKDKNRKPKPLAEATKQCIQRSPLRQNNGCPEQSRKRRHHPKEPRKRHRPETEATLRTENPLLPDPRRNPKNNRDRVQA